MLDQLILFIDAEAIVIDKPAGLPVDTPRRGGDSVVERLGELKQGFQRPPTPMHRLDQDTSGCLLLARSPKARSSLQKAFETRQVEKYYLAVVDGPIERDEGTIDLALVKRSSEKAGWRMVADPEGEKAITHWRTVAVREGHTLVEFRPVTGRTHQLRVHAREAFGRGIVGDRVYGVPGGPMLLHASRLVIPREKKPAIDVSASLPGYFGEWPPLDRLGTENAA
jgi:tRNA pseudouridine32 synthase / 23S rRNA pseudouridine746 synthase